MRKLYLNNDFFIRQHRSVFFSGMETFLCDNDFISKYNDVIRSRIKGLLIKLNLIKKLL